MRQARSQIKQNATIPVIDDDILDSEELNSPRINIFAQLSESDDDSESPSPPPSPPSLVLPQRHHSLPSEITSNTGAARPKEVTASIIRRKGPDQEKQRQDPKGGTSIVITSNKNGASPLELLLIPERRFLNFDSEARRIFGGRTAAPEIRNRVRKSYSLVTPDVHWIATPTRISGGFSMTRSDCGKQFTFVMSEEYNSIRDSYFAAESSGDPELVFEFVARFPFFSEALLQLFEYHRTVGNVEAAAASLRQCIFSLESAFHPNFVPWKDPANIVFNAASIDKKLFNLNSHDAQLCGPNELLFVSLLRYAQLCSKRACTESAFESAKLLFSLSPEVDPTRVLLVLDSYALRAGRSKWIVEITDTCGPHSSVPILFLPFSDLNILSFPGWLFARALSLFKLESGGNSSNQLHLQFSQTASSPTYPSVTSDSSICDLDATHLLVRALLTYPHLLLPLLKDAGIKDTDIGVGAYGVRFQSLNHPSCTPVSGMRWNQIFQSRLFSQPYLPSETSSTNVESAPLWSDSLRKLIDITASLQSAVWANPIHLSFLFTCAKLAAYSYDSAADDKLDTEGMIDFSKNNPPFITKNSQDPERYFASPIFAVAEAVTGTLSREEVFYPPDNNTESIKKIRALALKRYGCVRPSDYKDDAIVPIAEDLIADLQHNDDVNVNDENTDDDRLRPWLSRLHHLNLQNRSPFLLFFDSLLPWNILPYQTNDETTIWRGF